MDTDTILKVLVADDCDDHRDGIIRVINGVNDIECIGYTDKLQEIISLSKELIPDIVVLSFLDYKMEDSVIKTIIDIKLACPTSAVLTINEHRTDKYIIESFRSGVDAYLVNKMSRGELLSALRMISSGYFLVKLIANKNRLYYMCDVDTNLGQIHNSHQYVNNRILHGREIEILTLASKGKRNKEIAMELGISYNTVASHLVHIFRKLGVESRTEAVLSSMKMGLLEDN